MQSYILFFTHILYEMSSIKLQPYNAIAILQSTHTQHWCNNKYGWRKNQGNLDHNSLNLNMHSYVPSYTLIQLLRLPHRNCTIYYFSLKLNLLNGFHTIPLLPSDWLYIKPSVQIHGNQQYRNFPHWSEYTHLYCPSVK